MKVFADFAHRAPCGPLGQSGLPIEMQRMKAVKRSVTPRAVAASAKRWATRLLVGCAIGLLAAGGAQAQSAGAKVGVEKPGERSSKRFALVMGAYKYVNLDELPRVRADANAMAETFRRMGFTVVGPGGQEGKAWLNPSREQMADALETLAVKVERYVAENDGKLRPQVAIYYSGHGVEVGGENYLLPTDVKISKARHVMEGRALSLGSLLERLREAGPHLTLVILDACRTLPGKSAVGPGLASPSTQAGEFVMYAARDKEPALEFIDNRQSDKSPNSVYTRFLLQEIEQKHSLLNIALNVRRKVETATGGNQSPAYYDNYSDSNQLVLATGSAAAGAEGAGGGQSPSGQDDRLSERRETAHWEGANKLGCDGYRDYLDRYPTGHYAKLARAGVAQCEAKKEPPPPVKLDLPRLLTTIRDCAACPEMVVLKAGSFKMGDVHGDGESDEKPVRTVRITQPFAMGRYEVTQGQWKAVMESNPSGISHCGDDCPVENVSWEDVQVFIGKLNAKTGERYRLPSEAEWEYACRAGGRHKYCGSDNVDAVSWYDENSSGKTHAVGGKGANGWGLHDMSGNVWEWVQDCYEESYDKGQPSDGRAHEPSTNCARRVNRGGGWLNNARNTRSASRGGDTPDYRVVNLGFRLSRTLP
jgi:formylglycine-generating enzyme required for sulfatase activity